MKKSIASGPKPDKFGGMKSQIIAALEAKGYSVKEWSKGGITRYYITDRNGRQMGYLIPGDDGSTGSCQGITARAGEIKAILRAA